MWCFFLTDIFHWFFSKSKIQLELVLIGRAIVLTWRKTLASSSTLCALHDWSCIWYCLLFCISVVGNFSTEHFKEAELSEGSDWSILSSHLDDIRAGRQGRVLALLRLLHQPPSFWTWTTLLCSQPILCLHSQCEDGAQDWERGNSAWRAWTFRNHTTEAPFGPQTELTDTGKPFACFSSKFLWFYFSLQHYI